jgi:hypothetical protein
VLYNVLLQVTMIVPLKLTMHVLLEVPVNVLPQKTMSVLLKVPVNVPLSVRAIGLDRAARVELLGRAE